MGEAIASKRNNPQITIQYIALRFNVSRKALSQRLKGELPVLAGLGRNPILNADEEARVVKHCLEMADLGYGYDAIQVRNIVRYALKDRKITNG